MDAESSIANRALAFALLYCANGGNASAAARAVLGCSNHAAKRRGYEYLRMPSVRAHIRAQQARTVARAQLSRDDLLSTLENAVRTDIVRDLFACLSDPLSIPLHARGSIKKWQTKISPDGQITHTCEVITPADAAERLLKLQGLDTPAPVRIDAKLTPGGAGGDDVRDGLTDAELESYVLAKRAGRVQEAADWEYLARTRLADAVRSIEAEQQRGTT